MSVLGPSVGILWQTIRSYGLDPEPLFHAEGLDIQWPIEPGTRLPYDDVDAVRYRAVQACDDPDFGLRTAACAHPSQLGALGYAVLASTTLREALERMRRYCRVLNDQGHFKVTEEDGRVTASLSVGQPSRDAKARDDTHIAFLVTLCRMNIGANWNPLQVTFRHPRPQDTSAYEALFRCPVRFGAQANALCMSSVDADRPLPSANPALARMNERIAGQRLARLDRDNIPGRVRAAIMDQLPSGQVTDESVAEALHMTARTMHRRLKEDGENFRSLLKSVRQELAEAYIADDSLTLTEITFLLGFSEMSSFSRAFKSWHGISPSKARQEH